MKIYDTAKPCLAVYVIFRRDNKVAFVLRENTDWMNNHYGLIAGKVEKNEACFEAAIREAKEEAGIDLTPGQLKPALTVYRNGRDGTFWIDILFEAQDWQGEPYNAEPHKHSALEWLDPDNLPESTIPLNGFYLEQIKAGTIFAEWGWDV